MADARNGAALLFSKHVSYKRCGTDHACPVHSDTDGIRKIQRQFREDADPRPCDGDNQRKPREYADTIWESAESLSIYSV